MTIAYKNRRKDFSKSREREPSISGMFLRLNVLSSKSAEQSDRDVEIVETASS